MSGVQQFSKCLTSDSYLASQDLAQQFADTASLGVLYPSVRHREATCVLPCSARDERTQGTHSSVDLERKGESRDFSALT